MKNLIKKIDKKFFLRLTPYFIIIAWTAIIYSNSFHAPFTLDDFSSIQDNYAIRNPFDILAIWRFYSNRFILYYTISWDYYLHGTMLEGYHIVNLIIHILSGLVFFRILVNLLGLPYFEGTVPGKYKKLLSSLCALIFVSHPVQVNAVTYIIQRTASLAALFYFLTMLFYLKFRINGKLRFFFLTLLFTVIAMFTKENTITIPFMLAFLEFMFFRRKGKAGWIKCIAVLLILFLTVPIIPATNLFLHGFSQSDPAVSFKASTSMNRMHYFYTQMNVVTTYIRQLILPDNLNFDYSNDFPFSKTIWENHSYVSLAILAVIGLIGILNMRRNKLLSLGIFWFFIGLSIESSFISIKDVYFEHRLYFPVGGFILTVAGLIFERRKKSENGYLFRNPMLFFLTAASCMILAYSGVTIYRNYIFSDSIRLWADVVKKAPRSDRAHSVLATEYLNSYEFRNGGDAHLDLAEKEFKKSIELNYYNEVSHCNLAKVYLLKKDYNNCVLEAKKTLDMTKSVYAYNNLGLGYRNMGKSALAIQAFEEGYKLDKKCSFILENLADTYNDSGAIIKARQYYKEYLSNYSSPDIENKVKDLDQKIDALNKELEKVQAEDVYWDEEAGE